MSTALHADLVRICGADRVRIDAPLARWTTFRVGGPADVLVEATTEDELREVVAAARTPTNE